MNIGILNEKQGIMAVDSLDDLGHLQIMQIKKQMPEGAKLSDLAFFYMVDRDWIVINKNHALYEFYSNIIPDYLELSEKSRKEFVVKAPTEIIKIAMNILDDVIRYRVFLTRLGDRKAV